MDIERIEGIMESLQDDDYRDHDISETSSFWIPSVGYDDHLWEAFLDLEALKKN